MGITLTSKSIASTYDGLLKLSDNDPLSGAFKVVTDGFGNESGIQLNNSGDVNIAGILNVGVRVNTPILQLTGGTGTQGTFSWNPDEETVDLIQNGTTLQLGQEIHIHVKNQTGATIPDGTPVYATGTLGASGRIKVAPMIADGSIDAKYFLGIATETIANGADGKVTTFGKIRGLNTSAYAEGQTLWVSATSAGNFQTTRPLAPNLDLEVAIVINSHANNGTIFVRANNGHYLGTAHDVNISSVAENDLLVYKTNRWVNTKSIGDLSAANLTLTGYLRGPEVFVIDPAAFGNNEGLVQILGDLRVDGVTTTINSTTISVSDKNITLAKDAVTAGDANGAGITIAGANATLTYLSATDDFTFNKNVNASRFFGPLTGDVTGNADTADALSTARNIALAGSVTGNADFDGSGDIIITTTTNHNHDDLYYTETESDNRFVNVSGDTMTGDLTINTDTYVKGSLLVGTSADTSRLISALDANLAIGSVVYLTLGKDASLRNQAELSFYYAGDSSANNRFQIGLFGDPDAVQIYPSGNIITIGTLTASGGNSGQWNTAYTYSQVGHLPLAGGTLTGDLAISNAQPKLRLKETDTADLDKELLVSGGAFYIRNLNDDNTAGSNILLIDNAGNLTASGTLTAVGYNKTNWDAAYNYKINSGYFDSNTGDLVLTRQDDSTLEINFDDRYVIANTGNFKTNTYSVESPVGTQRYKLMTTSGQVDQFFHITINRAYDYGDNDQTKQQAIYQRRQTNKNLRWRLDGDLTATSQVFIEIYAKANGDDEVWLVCTDYAKPQVYVEHDGFFWNGLTNADTPTGTLIKTTELTASNKPNWDEQVGLIKTTELYSDTTYLRGSAFVLAPNGSSYDTLVYRDGTNQHVLYAGGGTSTQWNTAYGWGNHAGLYAPISHTHPYLPLSGGNMSGDINWGATNQGLTWTMNTDGAYIKFYNTGDGDTDSRLEYGTSDNGNEYHRFMISGTERMKITETGITATGYNKSNWDTAYSWGNHAGSYLPLSGGTLTGDVQLTANARLYYSSDVYSFSPFLSAADSGYVGGGVWQSHANITIATDTDGSGVSEFIQLLAGDGTPNTLKLLSKTAAAAVNNDSLTLNGNVVLNAANYTNYTDSKYLRSDESDTMNGSLTLTGNFRTGVQGQIDVNRGRLNFSGSYTDRNHNIYNNVYDLDGEGAWDGMKFNLYGGANFRVGSAQGIVPMSALYIDGDGRVGINKTTLSYPLDVNGNARVSGLLNSNDSFERVLGTINFPNGQSNLAFDIRLGNLGMWGYLEVEVNSTYNNQNSPGKLTKVFAVGTNPGNNIYSNESRVVDAVGPIANNVAIGEFEWDGAQSVYRVTISHIVSTGNSYNVKVRMYTQGESAAAVFNVIALSPTYNRTAFARNYVNYNDRVGIGTKEPESLFHIKNGDAGITPYPLSTGAIIEGSSGAVGLSILSPDNGYGRLYFSAPSSSVAGSVEYIHNATLASGYMKLRAGTIDTLFLKDGLAGIGTSDPRYKTHIAEAGVSTYIGVSNEGSANGHRQLRMGFGTGHTYATIQGTRLNTADDVNLILQPGGGSVGIGTTTPTDGKLQVTTTTSTALRIDTNAGYNALEIGGYGNIRVDNPGVAGGRFVLNTAGRVGIGVPSPTNKLHVYSSDNEGIFMEGTGGGHWFNFKSGTSNLWSMGAQTGLMGWYNRTDGSYKMVITDGGSVGIGTTDPSDYRLRVVASGAAGFRVDTTGSSFGSPSINARNGSVDTIFSATSNGLEIGTWSSNDILFKTGTSEKMRIYTNGNVGINQTSPQAKLHVGNSGLNGGHILSYGNSRRQERETGFKYGSGLVWRAFNHGGSTHPLTEEDLTAFYKDSSTTFRGAGITANVDGFTLSGDYYVVEFIGYLYVATAGTYTFDTNSDDGSDIFIDGVRVADYYGGHGASGGGNDGSVYLDRGYHRFTGRLMEVAGGDVATFSYSLNGGAFSVIPASAFFFDAKDLMYTYGTGGVAFFSSDIVVDDLQLRQNGNIQKIGSGSTMKIINSNSSTEMFVDGSGNLGIGISNNSALAKIHVGGSYGGSYASDASAGPLLVHNSNTTTSSYGIKVKLDAGTFGAAMAFWQGSTLRGYIGLSSGGTSYSTSSDYRLKENVVTLDNATERVMQLKPKRFNFIDGDGVVVDGFLAHEVQEVIPAAVQGEKDAIDNQGNPIYQGIDHSKLVPLLTASLQEALKRIETLEQKINQLTNNL